MADYQALGEAGIPVITYDSMVDGFDFSARVGSDNYVLGTQAAEEAIKYLESLDEINGEVICLNCPEGETHGDIGRARGFIVTPETARQIPRAYRQRYRNYEALARFYCCRVHRPMLITSFHIPENIELFYRSSTCIRLQMNYPYGGSIC